MTGAVRDRAVRLFGVVGAWMEEDVIGASVANAFHQGCEEVFLVDNDSPDRTVEVAVSSGATFARSFRTECYDERARIALMNETMHAVTERAGADRTWWLWFDADEFPHGPRGQPLARCLATLEDGCRVVGARIFHHFPTRAPHCAAGLHPLEKNCSPCATSSARTSRAARTASTRWSASIGARPS